MINFQSKNKKKIKKNKISKNKKKKLQVIAKTQKLMILVAKNKMRAT